MLRSSKNWTENFVVGKGLKKTVQCSRNLNEVAEIALNPSFFTSLCFNIIKFISFDDTSKVLFSHLWKVTIDSSGRTYAEGQSFIGLQRSDVAQDNRSSRTNKISRRNKI